MENINEFLNNNTKDKFDAKFDDLIFNTLHLSSFEQMQEDPIFKELLTYGDTLVPNLINRIINSNPCTSVVIYVLITKLIKINIKSENSGNLVRMKNDYKEWWEKNKDKYLK